MERFNIDHLMESRHATGRVPMDLSSNGQWLSVSVQGKKGHQKLGPDNEFSALGVPMEMQGSHVLVIDTQSGETIEPFPEDSISWGGQWSPSGHLLAAYVQHEGPACLGIWNALTKSVELFTHAEVRPRFGFETLQWTPDSNAVAVKLRNKGLADKKSEPQREQDCPQPAVFVLSFAPEAKQNASQPREEPQDDVRYCDLGIVDISTGAVRILAQAWLFYGWRIAPDGSAVAVMRETGGEEATVTNYFDMVLLSLDGAKPQQLAQGLVSNWGVNFNWSPDGRYLGCVTGHISQANRLCIISSDSSEPLRDLTGETEFAIDEEEAPRWSEDGQTIYCLGANKVWEFGLNDEKQRTLELIFPETEHRSYVLSWIQPPTSPTLALCDESYLSAVVCNPATQKTGLGRLNLRDGSAGMLADFGHTGFTGRSYSVEVAPNERTCYLVTEMADQAPSISLIEIGKEGTSYNLERLNFLNPRLCGLELGPGRLVEWRSQDGQLHRGALMLPTDYKEGQQVPLIVHVYGGKNQSHLVNRFAFDGSHFDNAHLLAAHGYAVFYPDMPMTNADPMRQLPGLVLPAINRVIDLGIADPNRIGLLGHSYGGYCVLALLTQTQRFRAAVSASGITNMTSFYSSHLYHLERGQGRLGGTPWQKRETYIENSPFFYLDRVQTPTLLITGEQDKTATDQCMEAYKALMRLEKRVELCCYRGETHWPGEWSEQNLRDACKRVIAWFETYLKT